MRAGVVFLLAVAASALFATAALAADRDTGRLRPPAALAEANKSIWMTEWVACRHERLGKLAKQIGIKVTSGRPPQVVAVLIAKKAEAPLYDNDAIQLKIAIDGCRNGILWRYYHES
jgi:hypothetical protein